jgi:hypothetical protein
VIPVSVGCRAYKGRLVLKAIPVRQGRKEILAILGRRATKAILVSAVYRGRLVSKVIPVNLGRKAIPARLGLRAKRAILESAVYRGRLVLKAIPVRLGRRAILASLGRRATPASAGLRGRRGGQTPTPLTALCLAENPPASITARITRRRTMPPYSS